MRLARSTIAIAWVLALAQAASALSGRAGVLLCRDSDGRSHVEWIGDHCCTADPAGAHRPGDEPRDTGACADCDDELLESGPAIARARAGGDLAGDPVAAMALALPEHGVVFIAREGGGVALRARWSTGPPRDVGCALRAIVMNL